MLVKTPREQGNGVRFAWLKEIVREIARKVERKRRREREKESEKTSVVANESEELTVERTGQDRERETD